MSFIVSSLRPASVPVLLCTLALAGCDGSSGDAPGGASGTVPYSTRAAVDVPVFPGAEGFGTRTPAGRGGRVCKVTNLQDRGEGSFRACAERGGPRIVVFETGGTIVLDEEIRISDPYISIYGQTAPGDGILLRSREGTTDSVLRIATHDVLVQHLRLRAAVAGEPTCCRDALSIAAGGGAEVHHVVIDHVSASWGSDEIMDMWYDTHDVTISRSIFSEGLFDNGSNKKGPAGRGVLLGGPGVHSISFHHNLLAHSDQRNPSVDAFGIVDVVNNLVYHPVRLSGQVQTSFATARVNLVGNRWIPFISPADPAQRTLNAFADVRLDDTGGNGMQVFFQDNLGRQRQDASQPEWALANHDRYTPYHPSVGWHTDVRHPAPAVTTMPAGELEARLPEDVGATLPRRDAVDRRIVDELRSFSGNRINCVSADDRGGDGRCGLNAGGWPYMAPGSARVDGDGDGMPDAYEVRVGLDFLVDDASVDRDGNGYSAVEEWVQTLGAAIVRQGGPTAECRASVSCR